MFLWHENKTLADRHIALTLENAATGGQALQVHEVRAAGRPDVQDPQFIDLGQKVACGLLDPGSMKLVTPPGLPILHPGDRAVLWHMPWKSQQLAGAQVRVAVESTDRTPPSYVLRTVYGLAADSVAVNGPLASIVSPLHALDSTGGLPVPHPVGAWDQNTTCVSVAFDVGADFRPRVCRFGGSDGAFTPDFTAETSVEAPARRNVALFGGIWRVSFTIASDAPRTLRLLLEGPGGGFAGSVKLDNQVRRFATMPAASPRFILSQPLAPGPNTFDLEIAVAGAASTPFALYLA